MERVRLGERGLEERLGDDHGEQPFLGREAAGDTVGLAEQLLLGDPPHDGLRRARPVRERPLGARRDRVEERQRERHDLVGDAIGVA